MNPRAPKKHSSKKPSQQQENLLEYPHSELKDSFNCYKRNFSLNNAEALIKLNNNYDKLCDLMMLHNDFNQICILFGFPGFGRKSSIDYCINLINENKEFTIKKLFIDASFDKSESAFLHALTKQLHGDEKPSKTAENKEKTLNFSHIFQSYSKKTHEKVVLVIDNVEEMAAIKRQTILYSLLEWIRSENNSIFVVFITNNIGFCELLEKRVKSRLSQTSLYFFSYTLENIQNIIEKRISMNTDKKINACMINVINSKSFKEIISGFQTQNKSIAFFLSYIRTVFCLLDANTIGKKNDFITNEEVLSSFLNAANEAKNVLMPSVLRTLEEIATIPQIIVLTCAKKLIKTKVNKLTFDEIMSKINDFHKNYSKLNQIINYSENVLFFALEDLIKLQFFTIDIASNAETFKGSGKISEIFLNIPMNDLEEFINLKKKTLPLAFTNFAEYIS